MFESRLMDPISDEYGVTNADLKFSSTVTSTALLPRYNSPFYVVFTKLDTVRLLELCLSLKIIGLEKLIISLELIHRLDFQPHHQKLLRKR